jgi:predicted MPP superfamily phosphohydrolase
VRDVVATVNRARPDLVVLVGDYVIHGVVGGRFVEPEPTAAALRELRAPLGVFAVLGNHDWWYDGARVGRALARYAIGHIHEDGRDLFVNPGLGTSIIPVRFRVPPEISLVTVGR